MKGKVYLFLLILFVIVSCSQDKLEFEKAIEIDTIKAYESFLLKYPDSDYSDQATKKIMLLLWERASKQNTIQAYQSFINQYPDSKFLNLAQENLYDLKWKKLRNNDNEVEYLLVLNEDNFDYSLSCSIFFRNKIVNRLQEIYLASIERERSRIYHFFGGMGMRNELRDYNEKLDKSILLISSYKTNDIIQGISVYRTTSLDATIKMRKIANF